MRTYTKLASSVILPGVLFLAGCGGAADTKPAAAQPAATQPAAAPPAATQPAPAQPAPAQPAAAQPAPTQPAATPPAPVQPAAAQPAPAAPGAMEINIRLGDHLFEPKLVSVPVGTKVKLTLTNSGNKKHDFTIEGAYKIESDLLSPGATQTFEFVADKAGQYKIVCTQRGHADQGMTGIFEVK